jgi:hypothetical protein
MRMGESVTDRDKIHNMTSMKDHCKAQRSHRLTSLYDLLFRNVTFEYDVTAFFAKIAPPYILK